MTIHISSNYYFIFFPPLFSFYIHSFQSFCMFIHKNVFRIFYQFTKVQFRPSFDIFIGVCPLPISSNQWTRTLRIIQINHQKEASSKDVLSCWLNYYIRINPSHAAQILHNMYCITYLNFIFSGQCMLDLRYSATLTSPLSK